MIVSSIIVNFREETSMRIRMVLNASHVASRLVKMVLPFHFFPCNFENQFSKNSKSKSLDERKRKNFDN